MQHFSKNSVGLALVFLAAAGCADSGGPYPSLALRPFETAAPGPAAPPAPAPNRPALPAPPDAAAVADLVAQAAASHAAFLAQQYEAERLARTAAGQPIESNARAAALVALADLDAQRGATAGTLARIDQLAAEAATALSPDPVLTAAQTDVAALLTREDAALTRLWETMES